MAQVEQIMKKQMRKAIEVASQKMLGDMYEETGGFYEGGEPKMYKRTGALGDTPQIGGIYDKGNAVELEMRLDDTHQYTTGKNPTMKDVLNLTNYGITNSSSGFLREAVGKQGYWERAKAKMEKSFFGTMSDFFK